jgi:hypothetical protein
MSKPDLSPTAAKLVQRMTGPAPSHPLFVGEPLELSELDALELGELWTLAHATLSAKRRAPSETPATKVARAIIDEGRDRHPRFRGAACRQFLDYLSAEFDTARSEPEDTFGYPESVSRWRKAHVAISRCDELSFDGLGAAARRFLAAAGEPAMPHFALALARLVGARVEADTLDGLITENAPRR